MNMYASLAKEQQSLVNEINALYTQTKLKMGDEDLAHIRNVAAYSKAIKARSEELIEKGESLQAWSRGVILGCLHTLLEFSELGHNIMHGSYDHLPNAGEFHSERWVWDFVTDPREWRVMHHQNHHPFTNIVGKDHDLGYSFLRGLAGQNWYGHHSVQLLIYSLLMSTPSYYFTLYTATSAARTEGRKILSKETFEKSLELIQRHFIKNFVQDPLSVPKRKLIPTFVGNYLKTTMGYGYLLHILFLEHHASNLELYTDPGTNETQEEYFIRQIRGTTNFIPYPPLDNFFKKILAEEVDYPNPPDFNVFYGGLDSHLEHHLFPDLPCNRQREVKSEVQKICAKYNLPYNNFPVEDLIKSIPKNLLKNTLPFGEKENGNLFKLLKKPKDLLKRIVTGSKYQQPSSMTYLNKPQFYNAITTVVDANSKINGQVKVLKIAKPIGWEQIKWDAGAYISLRFEIGSDVYVRQYSLLSESKLSENCFEIAVKRVDGGVVSNLINDQLIAGSEVTIVGLPQCTPDFVLDTLPPKLLFLAGGVGITPILSMLKKHHRIESKAEAHLFYFNRNEDSILFENELREIAKASNLKLHFICSSLSKTAGTDLQQGRFNIDLLKQSIADFSRQHVYICAPESFIADAKEMLVEAGLKESAFHAESFVPPDQHFESDGKTHTIHFVRSNISIEVEGHITLLDAAKQAGLNLPSGCKQGLCKACVCTKLDGSTQLDQDQETPDRRITLCNTVARSESVILDI